MDKINIANPFIFKRVLKQNHIASTLSVRTPLFKSENLLLTISKLLIRVVPAMLVLKVLRIL